ncbi:MAG: hypothetical protein NC235_07975 [Clostridiales bacterium]|nr:hypothetical protein [Clostridiales bacterium]MCM1435726.1 hypothetical protein [Ruminococcus flavefaciens]
MVTAFFLIKIINGDAVPLTPLPKEYHPFGSPVLIISNPNKDFEIIRAGCPDGNNFFQQGIKETKSHLISIIKVKCCYPEENEKKL